MTLATRDLAACEEVIDRGLATFVEVGLALMEIRDGRLYLESHETFDEYCRERWSMSNRHANRLVEAAEVMGALPGPMGPTTERQARALAPLKDDPEIMAEAWSEAVAESNGKPTAAAVEKAVEKRVPPRQFSEAEQYELDRQGAIRRTVGRLEQLVNGWIEIPDLPTHPERDAVLAGLTESDRLTVLEIESIYLEVSR